MNLQKRKNLGILLVLTFLGTYGVCYTTKIATLQPAFYSIASVFLAVVLFMLLSKTKEHIDNPSDDKNWKRRIYYALGVSFLFSLTTIVGYQLQNFGMTDAGVKGKGLIILRAMCLAIAVFPFVNYFFLGIEKIDFRCGKTEEKKPWKNGAVFGISAAVIFACLIPVWLAYYPIIMSYDFHRQVNEAALGFEHFWPYQPIAHTWIIWVFLQLGYAIGDLEAGMAGMALFQMLAYSLVAAYGVTFIFRLTKKKWAVVTAVLFFGVFPLNAVLVLCTTKDVLFSILFMLFVLLLGERFFFAKGKKKVVVDILLLPAGALMVQFRNNALYALVVFGVLWFAFAAKKEKLRVLLLCVLLVAGGKATSVIIKEAIGTEMSGAKVEMYSVPIQQFARVGYCHGTNMDEESLQILETYVPLEYCKKYNPPISDTVKIHVGAYVFPETWEGKEVQVLSDWFKLGLKFPNEYIDAFLELTRGYWFWDDRSHAECLGYGVDSRMGLIYTYNSAEINNVGEIQHETKFPWLEEQLEKIVSGNYYYDWPVISVLFKSAFYFWGLCLIFVIYMFFKRKEQAIMCLFPLLYMATMLLGPVVQIRYVFPVIVIFPVMLALIFRKDEEI